MCSKQLSYLATGGVIMAGVGGRQGGIARTRRLGACKHTPYPRRRRGPHRGLRHKAQTRQSEKSHLPCHPSDFAKTDSPRFHLGKNTPAGGICPWVRSPMASRTVRFGEI